jgi:hypothetical protein
MVGWDVVPQPLVALLGLIGGTLVAFVTGRHGQWFSEDGVNCGALGPRRTRH